MVQVIKKHKVTGEIVKVEAKKEWISYLDGTIPANVFAKIKEATEAGSDYLVIGQEGKLESKPYVMTEKDKELDSYEKAHAKVVKAMNY